MDQIKKYKIEDESLDNELDNNNILISSQLSQSNPKPMEPPTQLKKTDEIIIKNKENNEINNLNNISEINFTNLEINDESIQNANTNTNYHHVQIIDEDVENFKRRLDIMIKNFRTDTLKDFMTIKRNLLIEQKSVIESEKQKCDALLSSKSDLVEHLKDDLAKTQKMLNNQIIIKEKVTDVIFRQKYGKYQRNLKVLAFNGVLKKYHDKKKNKKNNEKKIRDTYHSHLKNRIFTFLKKNWKDSKIFKIVSAKEKECQDKLNEMAQFYGKEISDLRANLNEANLMIEKTKESKNLIQANLKKVLMRGVMAMNMEAMNVLDKDIIPKQEFTSQIEVNQSFQPNISNVKVETSGPIINPVAKDANWVNASSVPSNMKNNLLINNNDEYNMEIHDTDNNYSDAFNEETENKPYTNNITPTNPIERTYNSSQQSYFYEMQKNLLNIKSEYSAIKPSSVMEDSFNNSEFMNTYMQQPQISVNPNININIKPNEGMLLNKMNNYSSITSTNITNNQDISTTKNKSTVSTLNQKKKSVPGSTVALNKKIQNNPPPSIKKNNPINGSKKPSNLKK